MARRDREAPEEDLVRLYLIDIGKHKLLSKADEAILAEARLVGLEAADELDRTQPQPPAMRRLRDLVQQGKAAEQRFIESNLRLVVAVAKGYQASGVPLLDLVQDGNTGLMHAVEKFDHRRGFKFSTYATWWIRQSIARGIANSGRTIRLPVHAGVLLKRLRRTRDEVEHTLGRRPTTAELAAAMGEPYDKIRVLLLHLSDPVSLSAPLREGSDGELGDILGDASAVSPEEAMLQHSLVGEVEKALAPLDTRERAIVRLRYGLDGGMPQTLEALGVKFSLSRERIRQIEAAAMAKVKVASTAAY